ncbi:MAG: hypothetical protein ACRC7V_07265 [Lachnospiraceae bacterium]
MVLKRKITSKEDVENLNTRFIDFCIEKEEILSIGTPDKLREFICEVKAKYNDILLLIENSDKIYKNTHATSRYSEKLLDIFGYDKFTSFNITEKL